MTDINDDIAEAEAYAVGGLALSRKTAGRLAAAVRALHDLDVLFEGTEDDLYDWLAKRGDSERVVRVLAAPDRPGGIDNPTSDVPHDSFGLTRRVLHLLTSENTT